jgi:hypothetical protein
LGDPGRQLFNALQNAGWFIKLLWDSISDRVPLFGYHRSAAFVGWQNTDNATVSIHMLAQQYVALTEVPLPIMLIRQPCARLAHSPSTSRLQGNSRRRIRTLILAAVGRSTTARSSLGRVRITSSPRMPSVDAYTALAPSALIGQRTCIPSA